MDYVEWCDIVADGLADYAERQPSRWVHLHAFAEEFASSNQGDMFIPREVIIMDASRMATLVGVGNGEPYFQLRSSDLTRLRDAYSRWMAAVSIQVSPLGLHMLDSLNALGIQVHPSHVVIEYVDANVLVEGVIQSERAQDATTEDLLEVLEDMHGAGLLYLIKFLGNWQVMSTYLGAARLYKAHIASDSFIDDLRNRGEGDALDYKRSYELSRKNRFDFAKDVVSFANAGGTESRLILVGVEDDGMFHVPSSPAGEEAHRAALAGLTDTRLQEIVSSRTVPTPSVRVAYRGEHRDGPYVVLSIESEVANLPYRVFESPDDRNAANALQLGQVWVRKGSTNGRASQAEITTLEQRAALYVRIRAGA